MPSDRLDIASQALCLFSSKYSTVAPFCLLRRPKAGPWSGGIKDKISFIYK
ncbi:hypothetical protein DR66_3646 [Delftia acidovorans]|nr:hypothetical protein DR66_3646 [Delftia acidovorans]